MQKPTLNFGHPCNIAFACAVVFQYINLQQIKNLRRPTFSWKKLSILNCVRINLLVTGQETWESNKLSAPVLSFNAENSQEAGVPKSTRIIYIYIGTN